MAKALITGITGQDGAYLARFLLGKGYEVFGMVRRTSMPEFNNTRLRWLGIENDVRLLDGDLADHSSLTRILRAAQPDEIYNLARTVVRQDILGPAVVHGLRHRPRRRQPAGGHPPRMPAGPLLPGVLFGDVRSRAASRYSRKRRRSIPAHPTAVAKVYGHWITVNYRESFALHASSGILFNHESPLRGLEFVTRKVTEGVARIRLGLADTIRLGNMDARRDWGHAEDYVRAMWLMLQQDAPDDYVIGTGQTRSVREMCAIAFAHAGLDMDAHVVVDPEHFRPAEVDILQGNASKAKQKLGWEPTIGFEDMICEMVDADLRRLGGRPRLPKALQSQRNVRRRGSPPVHCLCL